MIFVFGQKATGETMQCDIHENIKADLRSAKVYGEGRGIRIDIKGKEIIQDIKKLVNVKLKY